MTQPRKFSVACPTQIQFGVGQAEDVAAHLPRNAKSVVAVTGASGIAAGPVIRSLRTAGVSITQIRCASEPSVPFVSAVVDMLEGARIDAVVACGGGSVIDTGKLLAFLVANSLTIDDDFDRFDQNLLATVSSIPCIAVPTTAGTGAEVTANCVLSVPSKSAKISLRGRALTPAVALVDPSLMKSAPKHVVLRSGLDAVTQVIEAYTSNAATPFSDGLSYLAIDKGLQSLRSVIENNDNAAWNELAWVSLASGLALANSGLGAAHGLAAVIGGRYDAPHGALCGRLLVPVLRRNYANAKIESTAHERLAECAVLISRAFPTDAGRDQFSGFETWMRTNNLPRLSEWGLRPADFEGLACDALNASSSQKNAVPLRIEDFVRVLEDAL